MTGFNLSDWAIRHRPLISFFMIVIVAAGVFSYLRLGRTGWKRFAHASCRYRTCPKSILSVRRTNKFIYSHSIEGPSA